LLTENLAWVSTEGVQMVSFIWLSAIHAKVDVALITLEMFAFGGSLQNFVAVCAYLEIRLQAYV